MGSQAQTFTAEASTIMGNDYMATSSAASNIFGATTVGRIIKTGSGTLSAVVIMGANTGVMNFYNATTTNILARTGNTSTSSVLIASFPASIAAGTYTLDAEFNAGLLLELWSGNMATSTVVYR